MAFGWPRSIPKKILLEQGNRYRATVILSTWQSWASNETVADKFRELGFTDVEVTGSGSTRSAQGVWPKPDQTVDLPEQIRDVEVVSA